MKRANATIALYVLLVFAGGVAVGGFGHQIYTAKTVTASSKRKTPEEYRRDYMSEMTKRLSLSDEQAAGIEKALDATRDRFREFRERTRPEMDKIQADQTAAVQKILSAEQMAEYARMRAEREEKKKQAFGGGR